jgi:hypothetical protein
MLIMRKPELSTLMLVLLSGLAFAQMAEQLTSIQHTVSISTIWLAILLIAFAGLAYYLKKKTVTIAALGLSCTCLLASILSPLLLEFRAASCSSCSDCVTVWDNAGILGWISIVKVVSLFFMVLGAFALAKHYEKNKDKRLLLAAGAFILLAVIPLVFLISQENSPESFPVVKDAWKCCVCGPL